MINNNYCIIIKKNRAKSPITVSNKFGLRTYYNLIKHNSIES